MTRTNIGEGFLRQLPVMSAIGQNVERRYPLMTTQEVVIGREPTRSQNFATRFIGGP